MSAYLVWSPDRDQRRDGAPSLLAVGPRDAAELWARCHAGFDGDPFSEVKCIVALDAPGSKEYRMVVQVEAEPVFTARLLQGVEP